MDEKTIRIDDRLTRPVTPLDPARRENDGPGPVRPEVGRPEPRNLMDRMRKVDPKLGRNYRQRSGE
ncbi:MAG: ubiquitin-like protein UBact [Armatimonadota bacterium]